MVLGDLPGVAQPRVHDVGRLAPHQFRLAAGPEVHEELGPLGDTRTVEDLEQARAEVDVARAATWDDVHGPRRCLGPRLLEVGTYLGEDRHDSRAVSVDMLLLLDDHGEAVVFPVDPLPRQLLELTGDAEAGVPGQHHDQPPFVIRAGRQDGVDLLAAHEELPGRVPLGTGPDLGEGVVGDELAIFRVLEELPGPLDLAGDRGRGVFLGQPLPVVPGPAGMDLLDRLVGPEMRDEEPSGRLVIPQRIRLQLRPALDVAVDVVAEPNHGLLGDDDFFPRSHESGLHEPGVNPVTQRRDPESRLRIDRMTGDPGGNKQLDPDLRALGRALRDPAKPNRDPAVVGGEETDPPRRAAASGFSIKRCHCLPSLRNRVIKPVWCFQKISATKRLQTLQAQSVGFLNRIHARGFSSSVLSSLDLSQASRTSMG